MTTAPLSTLSAQLPAGSERLAPDAILDRFLAWVSATGLALYPRQEEAILELLDGKHVILTTPTGSGKSLVATALHFKAMAEGKRSFYTCPIKALVNEKFFALVPRLRRRERRHDDRRRQRSTATRRSSAAPPRSSPTWRCARARRRASTYVVMDEFHYYARPRARRRLADAAARAAADHASCSCPPRSATRASSRSASRELTGREVAVVRSRERPVPLDFEYRETPLHETIEELVASGKAPVYLVNFTQRARRRAGAEPDERRTSPRKEEKEAIRAALDGVALRQPVRQGDAALPAARHRPAPRRAPAEVPAARREARAERACSRSSAAPTRSASA